MRRIAYIPARSGSKGIPKKNIRPLPGRPLLGWMVVAAQKTGHYAVYNLISRTEPRCMMFVYRDRAKAEAKRAEMVAQYGADVILDNLEEVVV